MATVIDRVMGLLGVSEEEVEEYVVEEEQEELATEPWTPQTSSKSSTRQPKEKVAKNRANLISIRGGQAQTQPQTHMIILEPEEFSEVRGFVDLLRNNRSVIVKLNKIEGEDAQRAVDFMAGATHALDGSMRKLGPDIFCFAPSSVVIEGEVEEDLFALHDDKK